MPGRARPPHSQRLPTPFCGSGSALRFFDARGSSGSAGAGSSPSPSQPPDLNSCQIWWYSFSAVTGSWSNGNPVLKSLSCTTAVARFSGT